MTELASLRQRSREEVLPVPVEPVLESKAVTPPVARKSHSTKPELVHPVVKRNSEVAEAEMWRRRYEHLAGLLADTTKVMMCMAVEYYRHLHLYIRTLCTHCVSGAKKKCWAHGKAMLVMLRLV